MSVSIPFTWRGICTSRPSGLTSAKTKTAGRFRKVVSSVAGKRLTYKELIGHGATRQEN